MKRILRKLYPAGLALLITWVSLLGQAPKQMDIGDITYQGQSKAKPVNILSKDERIQKLLTKAFSMHGGFSVKPDQATTLQFRFAAAGPNKVQLSIATGAPPQVKFSKEVLGIDWRDAALRAADLAVVKTLEIPGIFAGRLAFVSDRTGNPEIYISDLFLEKIRQKTSDRSLCVWPRWAPDGTRLLYTSYIDVFPNIFQIDLPTGKRKRFVPFKGTNTGAAFHSKGGRVAMTLSGTGNSEVYISNAQGKNIRRLTRNNSLEASPSWSPDGARLVFTSDLPGRPQLYQVHVKEPVMQRLPTNISGYCAEPAWNPRNPDLIAFTVAQGKEFEIALFDFTTRSSKVLTKGAGDAIESSWTRDGRHLLFTQRTSTSRRLMLLDTETGKLAPLHSSKFGNTWQASFAYLRQ